MTHFLDHCWNAILQREEAIAADPKAPLVYLDKYCECYNLSPLSTSVDDASPPPIVSISPTFKDLTEENLLALRLNLYRQAELETVAQWTEKLLRFCEVRYGTLKKRAIAKCQTANVAQLHVLHLAAFLMDYGLHTKDLRFFNIVLKLCDLPWLIPSSTQITISNKKDHDLTIALFQFRLLLLKNYTLDQLNKGEAI